MPESPPPSRLFSQPCEQVGERLQTVDRLEALPNKFRFLTDIKTRSMDIPKEARLQNLGYDQGGFVSLRHGKVTLIIYDDDLEMPLQVLTEDPVIDDAFRKEMMRHLQ